MFGKKIKIPTQIMERIKEAVEVGGYSSVNEFVESSLEREIDRVFSAHKTSSDDEEKVNQRLRGLGYID